MQNPRQGPTFRNCAFVSLYLPFLEASHVLSFLRYQATSYYPAHCGALLHSQSHTKYNLQVQLEEGPLPK